MEFGPLRKPIDTTSSGGRLVFAVFTALGWVRAHLTSERTNAGAHGRVSAPVQPRNHQCVARSQLLEGAGF